MTAASRGQSVIFGTGGVTRALIHEALATGYRRFDTAVIYPSRAALFECSKDADRELELIVKMHPYRVREQFDKLVGPFVGPHTATVLLHHPFTFLFDSRTSAFMKVWRELEALVHEGRVTNIGVSNTGLAVLRYLVENAEIRPAVNQVEVHPFVYDADLLRYCAEQDIEVQAYSPLGRRSLLEQPAIKQAAAALDRTPAQICLRWLTQKGATPIVRTGALLKQGTLERARESLAITDFQLDEAQVADIDALWNGTRLNSDAVKLGGLFGTLDNRRIRVPNRLAFARRSRWLHSTVVQALKPASATGPRFRAQLYRRRLLVNLHANRRCSHLLWKYLFNIGSRVRFLWSRALRKPLEGRPLELMNQLRRHGYAVTNVDEMGARELFDTIEIGSDSTADPRGRRSSEPAAFELAKNKTINRILDEYSGLTTVVQQAGRISHRAGARERVANANWHVDVEDFHVLKAMYFLTDVVGEGAGPLELVPGTNPHGADAQRLADILMTEGIDTTSDRPLDIEPTKFFGKAGTVVLFDARTLHRGGFCTDVDRQIVFHSHTAPYWIHPQLKFARYISSTFKSARPLLRALSPWSLLLAPLRWGPSGTAMKATATKQSD